MVEGFHQVALKETWNEDADNPKPSLLGRSSSAGTEVSLIQAYLLLCSDLCLIGRSMNTANPQEPSLFWGIFGVGIKP